MSVPPEEIITDDGKTHLDYCYRKEKGGQAVARKRNQEMDEENNLRENKTRHSKASTKLPLLGYQSSDLLIESIIRDSRG